MLDKNLEFLRAQLQSLRILIYVSNIANKQIVLKEIEDKLKLIDIALNNWTINQQSELLIDLYQFDSRTRNNLFLCLLVNPLD